MSRFAVYSTVPVQVRVVCRDARIPDQRQHDACPVARRLALTAVAFQGDGRVGMAVTGCIRLTSYTTGGFPSDPSQYSEWWQALLIELQNIAQSIRRSLQITRVQNAVEIGNTTYTAGQSSRWWGVWTPHLLHGAATGILPLHDAKKEQ